MPWPAFEQALARSQELEGLLADPRFNILTLAVHSRLPKSEDPQRSIRPEFTDFENSSP